jgi:hypothetical protein
LVWLRRILFLLIGAGGAISEDSLSAVLSLRYDVNGNTVSRQLATASPPGIHGSTPSQVVSAGGISGFSINVSTTLAVTYQWYFNGVAIAGATGDSLLLTNISLGNEGNYTVVVTNSSGSVTSGTFKLGIDFSGNGLPDSWEMTYFGNLNQTADGDHDGDGISNLDEFINGTDPTVREIYYWNVASGDFNTPINWIRHNTPGVPPRAPGAGDTAIVETGTFTLPLDTTIGVSQVIVNAPFTAPADRNLTLNITGTWTFNGPFTLANGRQFAVTGNGGSAIITGTTNLNGGNLLVDNGATLSFPAVVSYAVPTGMGVQWLALHGGALLRFPNLTAISGPATPGTYFDLQSAGYNGVSTLSLPALTTITKEDDGDGSYNSGVRLSAYQAGVISAPNLSVFQDNDSHPNSSLDASAGGVLSFPQLLAPRGLNINLNDLSHPEQFTSLVGTRSFQINAGIVVLSNLESITGFSFIGIDGGAQVSFPNVTTYAVPPGMSVQWQVLHVGAVLSFPNLTTVTGPTTPGTYLDLLSAGYNGVSTLSLPVLTTITKEDDGDAGNNSGVRLTADQGGVIFAPYLSIFYDNDSHPNSSLNASNGGTMILYSLALSGIHGVTLNGVTLPAIVPPPKAINLSTRMPVQTGDNVGIGGFIITGSTTKRVIIRAIGPSLTGFGVPNALPDPVLELHGPSAFVTVTNNNWRDKQENEIQATGIPPANDLESAIVATLVPGAYTAIVSGNGGNSGVGLIEVYDLTQTGDAKLANLSTRAAVNTGDNIVIAGFVLSIGNGNDRIVVRGLGPSLAAFGVPNALADPRLELRDTQGALLASNNDWHDHPAQAAELTAAGLAPTDSLESAMVATLPTGLYTALLSGTNGNTGVGVVEVYDLGGAQ